MRGSTAAVSAGSLGKHDDDLVIKIQNVHFAACGKPPAIVKQNQDGQYVGYFTNQYGEQLVLVIDLQAKSGQMFGGDFGWEQPILIENNRVLGGPIFGDDEAAWLRLCWHTATGEGLHGVIDSQSIWGLVGKIAERPALETDA